MAASEDLIVELEHCRIFLQLHSDRYQNQDLHCELDFCLSLSLCKFVVVREDQNLLAKQMDHVNIRAAQRRWEIRKSVMYYRCSKMHYLLLLPALLTKLS
jgi:hypothetical protein